ncbi:hypothetical protein MHYP_G00333110 [Metynnis hypsauchen]
MESSCTAYHLVQGQFLLILSPLLFQGLIPLHPLNLSQFLLLTLRRLSVLSLAQLLLSTELLRQLDMVSGLRLGKCLPY